MPAHGASSHGAARGRDAPPEQGQGHGAGHASGQGAGQGGGGGGGAEAAAAQPAVRLVVLRRRPAQLQLVQFELRPLTLALEAPLLRRL